MKIFIIKMQTFVVGLIITLLCITSSLAQITSIKGRVFEKKDGKWFQIENGRSYEVNNKIITVKYKNNISENSISEFQTQKRVKVIRSNILGFTDLEIPSGTDPMSIVLDFNNSNLIEVAEPNTFGFFLTAPNDPSFINQWPLYNINDADIDADEAWGIETGKSSVIIGLIDSGTDWTHIDIGDATQSYQNLYFNPGEDAWPIDPGTGQWRPELGNHIDDDGNQKVDDWIGWDFKNANNDARGPDDHGTNVAGIVAAKTNSSYGIAGVAGGWGVQGSRLMLLQIGDYEVDGSVLDDAILYAAQKGSKVINMTGEVAENSAINAALQTAYSNYGCFMVCAAGNMNGTIIYPASNQYVLAIGSTDNNDTRAPDSNYGPSLDLTAPGVNILTTAPGNSYAYHSGTSFAAPHVAGVAALVWSTNSSLTRAQVTDIIQLTAEDKGTLGRDDYYGYGRINAYQALLLTHAYSRKSITNSATANSSQRKIIRTGTNTYHIVFLSGGEIFYQKTTDNGSSWQTPIRLSSGNGNNNYPSIAKGSTDQVMVVWSRQTTTGIHDIHFAMSTDGGTNWPTRYALASSCSSANAPSPVIAMIQSNGRKTVVYSTNSGLISKTTVFGIPTTAVNWDNQQLTTSSSDIDPSIASCGTSSYNILTYRSGSSINYGYQNNNGTWSSFGALSGMIPGQSLNVAPTICGMPTDGSVHLAWTRYSYSGGYPTSPKTFYTKNTSANGTWPYQYWQVSTWDEVTPTITALASNKIDLIFQATNNGLYKQRFNGSSWNSPSLVDYPTSKYPSVSIGGTSANFIYTNGNGSPFEVRMGTSELNKESPFDDAEKYYSRSIAFIEPEGSFIEYILHNIKVSKENSAEYVMNMIPAVLEDKSLSSLDAFDVQSSEYFVLDKDAKEIVIDYNINSLNSDKVVNDITKPVYLVVTIIDENGKQLSKANKLVDITQKNETFNRQSITIPVAGITGNVKVNTHLEGLDVNKEVIVSLGHLYDHSSFTADKENVTIEVKTEEIPTSYSLKNYPNPFNPMTTISYSMPEKGHASIIVFDILGREVTELVNEDKESGTYTITFDGNKLSSGVYICTMAVNDYKASTKLILAK